MLALVERDGGLLMERRSDCGRWGLVGGMVEVEESLEEALRREVREETGLVVRACTLAGILTDPSRIVRYPDGNVVRLVTFVFRAEVESFGPLRPSEESEELRFFGPEELSRLDVIETARPVVDGHLSGRRPRLVGWQPARVVHRPHGPRRLDGDGALFRRAPAPPGTGSAPLTVVCWDGTRGLGSLETRLLDHGKYA